MKTFFYMTMIAIGFGVGGWWVGRGGGKGSVEVVSGRKILHYQSPMHPWVRSDRPGKCTVCGMDLVPVYEGGQKQPLDERPESSDLVILPEGTPNVANLRTEEVRVRPLVRTLRVAGVIDDNDSQHRILSAYTGGRIEKLFINYEGAEVEAGQPLATFYSKELLNLAGEYRTAVKLADRGLVGATESRLRQLGLTREQIQQIPQRAEGALEFELLAPRSGTVTKRHVYEGQYVKEGDPLFEIADFSTMWFQFIAYEQDLPFLRGGQRVEIRTPSLPGRTFQSTIKFINPNLDEATRSARVRVEILNPAGDKHLEHEMLHRLYATGVVEVESEEVLAIPQTAVLWAGSGPRVYVEIGGGAYQQRAVKIGRVGDELSEVLAGVKSGERVVVSGNMLLDGQAQLNHLADVKPLDLTQKEAVGNYLHAVADLSAALAADEFPAFEKAVSAMPMPPEGFPKLGTPTGGDLKKARRGFLAFSQTVAEKAISWQGRLPELRIFQCPMSNQVGPGVPENARWVQWGPGELLNPYLGKEMLHCGTEVKP